ncbi:MAG: acetyl-CoA carboxylase carboxyl transferase subunit alpha [candidate division Zixibacteria bacterium CG_4_9_14_3_um_filter_46_8]|nr:MAG: acetyl-CoA carboxylase carboxyl transferase subunit alpha [candidate division Zixibacteria bacterium CG_4_9_14_3_um_filter_46_8]
MQYLDFEKPIFELEKKISELKEFADGEKLEISSEIKILTAKLERLQREIYKKMNRWQRVKIARHPARPYTLDYIEALATDFIELHGDRGYGDDKAIVVGLATLEGRRVLFVGQQKGRDVKQRQFRNFGMCHPEGYRKALRGFQLADRFKLPIVILIDTPGAYPGIEAEERGQAEAIARNLREMCRIRVPIVVVVIGEGASGGALGIGLGDKIFMLENSWYSVISPEGCAAILWKENPQEKYETAADALRVTAQDAMGLGIVDKIIPEPLGGAHRDPGKVMDLVRKYILGALEELERIEPAELLAKRLAKYRKIGVFEIEKEN